MSFRIYGQFLPGPTTDDIIGTQVGIRYSVVSGYRAVIEYRAVIGYFICGSFCKRIRVLLQLSKMAKDPYSRILYPRIRYSSSSIAGFEGQSFARSHDPGKFARRTLKRRAILRRPKVATWRERRGYGLLWDNCGANIFITEERCMRAILLLL